MTTINVGNLIAYLTLQDQMSPALQQAILNLQQTELTSQFAGRQVAFLGRGMLEAGMLASTAFTVPIVAATKATAELGSEFEIATVRLVSLANVTQSELAGVKQHILDLAPAVGIGPIALTEAMYKVSSVLGDTKVAMEVLDVSAKASVAGLGDAKAVAGALVTVINAYGKENIDAAKAVDIL